MIRKTALAICIFTTLVIVVVWPVSYYWHPSWYDTMKTVKFGPVWGGYAIYDGIFVTQWEQLQVNYPAWYVTNGTMPDGSPFITLKGGTDFEFNAIGVTCSGDWIQRKLLLCLPFPLLVALPGVPATLLAVRGPLLRRRRKRRGLCVKCGYNLAGNESGTCSECGKTIDQPVPTAVSVAIRADQPIITL